MDRSSFIPLVFILGAIPGFVASADHPPATYILQLTSNLDCDTLDIELVSQANDTRENIRFTSSAYAAVDVPSGAYAFGDVICTNKGSLQAHSLLSEKMALLNFTAGQTYYGGRMIFQELVTTDPNGAPDVLGNCTGGSSRSRSISGFRSGGGGECRDGLGVDASAMITTKINLYLPEVMDDDIELLRTALTATKEQLLYLPLKS